MQKIKLHLLKNSNLCLQKSYKKRSLKNIAISITLTAIFWGSVFTTPLFTPLSKRLQNSAREMEPVLINLSVAGTGSPSVLRRRVLAPYVPLRTRCSESVPATDRFVGTRFVLLTEFFNHLFTIVSKYITIH